MAEDWKLTGKWMKNCNCAYGCPCDFNAPPTYTECTGMAGMAIDQGYYGDVKLDGLRFAVTYHWPGPLHEGGGTMQAVIDERATEEQREALMTILSGQASDEGTMFHIFSLIVDNHLEPQFKPIDFAFDQEARTARMAVDGMFETVVEPIKNPITGAPHRIQVVMPEGFEHKGAEVASAATKGLGEIGFDIGSGHSTLATVTHTPAGIAA